jgi:carbamoyltransferase
MARAAIKKYNCSDIAIGGGVFMNVKANQYLSEMPEVTSVVIAPSCGDESLALGAAAYGYAQEHNFDLSGLEKLENIYLGSEYSDEEVKTAIDAYPFAKECEITYFDPTSDNTIEKRLAEILAGNSVVGRLKGRAEWGARALGNRSILANPSSRDNVKLINEMIKGRDFWMPFASSMLYESRHDYLVNPKDTYAPFMAITFDSKPLAQEHIIAALHPYDLTCRPQMIKKEINPEYHALISHYKTLTGSGGILNTSFNLHGEPNVENPLDALRTFEHSGLPHVAIGNYLVSKK